MRSSLNSHYRGGLASGKYRKLLKMPDLIGQGKRLISVKVYFLPWVGSQNRTAYTAIISALLVPLDKEDGNPALNNHNKSFMQAIIQLRTVTRNQEIHPDEVVVKQQQDGPVHPRLGFARSFLQHILSDHYPALQVGDQFKENTLLFTFLIQEVHITAHSEYNSEKKIIVTGLLQD